MSLARLSAKALVTSLALLTLSSFGCSSSEGEAETPARRASRDATRSTSASQVGWSCSGSYGKTKAQDGKYYATSFGCYASSSGKIIKDPGDNCIPGCGGTIGSSLCPNATTGPACEAAIKWFAADAARYSCGARLKVTNEKNGRSVVVVAIDNGPACSVEAKVKHTAIDLSYPSTDYLFGEQQGITDRSLVTVVEVSDSTPLGPVTGGSADDPGNGDSLDGGSGGSGSGDPGDSGSGDPGDSGSGDPGDSGSGDPGDSGSGDPGDSGSGGPGDSGSGDAGDAGNGEAGGEDDPLKAIPLDGSCGSIDFAGQCAGNILAYCDGGELQMFECLTGCGFDKANAWFDCGIQDKQESECAKLGVKGDCQGTTLRYCSDDGAGNEEIVTVPCGDYGATCKLDESYSNFYECY
jgi:hypothetical protein